jgi:signal transduction histidine kinase/ligand-binding sensor domain-containing protein
MNVLSHQPGLLYFSRVCVAGVIWGGLLVSASAFAQSPAPPNYQFDRWTTDDGLPQNAVNDILQTRDGYLWLATFDGLARFDGQRFTVFNKGNTEGIGGNRFDRLFEDRQGVLWAMTDESWLVRHQEGRFTTYTPKEGLPPWTFLQIEEDEAGRLQVVSRTGIAKRVDGQFVSYSLSTLLPIPAAARWVDGNRLAWRTADHLRVYSRGRLKTYPVQSGWPNLRDSQVFEDQHGNHWLSSMGRGGALVKEGRLAIPAGQADLKISVPAQEDRRGNTWLAGERTWLGRWKEGRLTRYAATNGFPASSVMSFYEDREGNFWIGTSNGLYRAREATITAFSQRDGLSSDNIYSICEDRAGALWFGTWGGGVTRYKDGHSTYYRMKEGLTSDDVTSLYEDRDGNLWVGTTRGLHRLDHSSSSNCHSCSRRLNTLPDLDGSFRAGVWAIHQDRAGRFWFGTGKGLIKFEDGRYTRFTAADGLAGDDVKAILEDRAGHLWFGTWGGLSRYADGRFTSYTERDGLASDHIRALYEDADGILWIGTYDGGLARFKGGRFTRYTVKDGLFSNGVFQILEDGRGYFWMSSNKGIYRVSRQELNDFAESRIRSITSVAYGKADGMLNVECNGGRQPAGWKTRDGSLWFPTAHGAAVIDPSRIELNRQPPPVVIEEFRLNNEAIDFRDGVEIPPDQDSFEIRYTAPSFIKPEHIKFKYKLEGLDEAWIDANHRRTASYNRIPPGRYRFLVSAANSEGVGNAEGASQTIVIIPPFWQRWWFVMIDLGVLIATPLLIYRRYSRRRLRQVEKEKAAQEAFSRRLIESQEAERKRIAGELHDGLGHNLLMIRNWAQVTLSKAPTDERVKKTLTDISETALQSVDEARRIAHHLRPHLIDDLGLTQAINAMLNNVADSSGIRFGCELERIDNHFSKEDEINLYRIVQECLNNIVKHSGATEAGVRITKSLHMVVIEIEDNGQGFDPQTNSATAGATGLGLKDIAERARILNGIHQIDSVPGKGTKITTRLNLQGARNEQ